MTPSSVRAFIDRLEGDIAVLLLGDGPRFEMALPKRFLPPDVREGSVLVLRFELDEDAGIAEKERITRLIDTLDE
jgi:hypothetical protein